MSGLEQRIDALVRRFDLPADAAPALRVLAEGVSGDPTAPTTVRDLTDVVHRHLADSLVALELPEVAEAPGLADLGAGAGFPGLALAAARPDRRVVLVESVRRKAEWAEGLAARAGLHRVGVACTRAEAWTDGLGAWPLVTARALAALPVLVEYAAPLLQPNGHLVAWKGRRDAGEEAAAAAAAEQLGLEPCGIHRVVPFPRAEHRHLHSYRKIAPTPQGFPRRPGMAVKRPLGGSRSDREPQ